MLNLTPEVCALRHLSINTEKTFTYWLFHDGSFLKAPRFRAIPPEKKIASWEFSIFVCKKIPISRPLCLSFLYETDEHSNKHS